MKIKIVILICFLSVFLFNCQTTSRSLKINNPKSSDRRYIPGTKFSLILPEDFKTEVHLQGFYNKEKRATIRFSMNELAFDPDDYIGNQYKEKEWKNIVLNGLNVILRTKKLFISDTTFLSYTIISGNENATYYIIGSCPMNQKQTCKTLLNSLLTLDYNPDQEIDILSFLNYRIDFMNANFLFYKMEPSIVFPEDDQITPGVFYFTIDGQNPKYANDNSNLMVTHSVKLEIEDKKQYAINTIESFHSLLDSTNIMIKNIKPITINSISGYEIIAYSENFWNQPYVDSIHMYQVMLFENDIYYLMIGTTSDDKNLQLFKDITQTFKRK